MPERIIRGQKKIRVIIHASELLTGAKIAKKNGIRVNSSDLEDNGNGRIVDGALVYESFAGSKKGSREPIPGKILWVGPTQKLPKEFTKKKYKKNTVDLKNAQCLIPGLVDCHTHLIFSGNRASEFAERCAGATYQEIAKKGGGIASTVRATREATEEELFQLAKERVLIAKKMGTRVLEIKSGYGLDHATELKIIRVANRIKHYFQEMRFQITYLGAHAWPPEQHREDYLNEIIKITLPKLAKSKLVDACDVFVDEGYFNNAQAELILKRAKALGLKIKIHADELGQTNATVVATQLKALSADHLLCVSKKGIKALAKSGTVAVLLPGTAFYLKAKHAPARKLIDAGARVAISTDFNPGTCMTLSLPSVMTISALYLGLSSAELFAAVTYNAAAALGLEKELGTLQVGKRAFFSALPFKKFEELYYRFAWNSAE